MRCTPMASPSDKEKVVRFLRALDLLGTCELLPGIERVSEYPDRSVSICWRGEEPAGMARLHRHSGMPAPIDWHAVLATADREAADALLSRFPETGAGSIRLIDSSLHDRLLEISGMQRMRACYVYTVSPDRFLPVAAEEEVIQLSPDDIGLFEGCEARARECLGRGNQIVFAILRQGRVAASAVLRPLVDGPHGVDMVSRVSTEPAHRRMGLGKKVVSRVTRAILQRGNAPAYVTVWENTASQNLSESLGYRRHWTWMDYRWRKDVP